MSESIRDMNTIQGELSGLKLVTTEPAFLAIRDNLSLRDVLIHMLACDTISRQSPRECRFIHFIGRIGDIRVFRR